MIQVSNDFKLAMKQPVKQLQAYIRNGSVNITDADDLQNYKISCDSGMCKTAMRKLEAKYIGEHNLIGQWVSVGFGVKLANGTYEYLDYGSFLVTEMSTTKDTGVTNIIGYDKMINAMTEYTPLDITYPINLLNYTQAICDRCNIELGNSVPNLGVNFNEGSLSYNNLDLELDEDNGILYTEDENTLIQNGYLYTNLNSIDSIFTDTMINEDLYYNISGITYRDILVQIAQATASTCIITNEDKIYFKPITATNENLTYDNMIKLKLEPKYGEINSVVLSRTPAEDNIYRRDETSILENGLTEFKIENNEIIDKDRDTALDNIYPILQGIYYYPFETTTEGLGWYEIGDQFTIVNNTNNEFYSVLFNYSITIDGSLKEVLKTVVDSKPQTQYQYASTIAKRVKNAEIIVNKQDQYIKSLVSDMYDVDGVVNNKFTEVYQDINNIINNVQNSGGNNLLRNSVMFAYDEERNPSEWTITGGGTLTIDSNIESKTVGAISGHGFSLLNKYATQTVQVKKDDTTISEKNKTYYTFSTRIKKLTGGNCYIKIYNSVEEYTITIPSGESAFYKEYSITLLPKDNYYTFEFYGSADSGNIFTDNMFVNGKYKAKWQQANGEIMNTQVNINVDGVLVKSSVYLGDYTVMSPLEFAGYSKINGTITRVFYLNKDVTYTKKLKAGDEITMVPIKIVPVTSGSKQGWAFVPSTEEV